MKNYLFLLLSLTICKITIAGNPAYPKGFEPQKGSHSVTFTENKGQVSDQNNKPRPDVLYGGMIGSTVFHLRKTGISYQFAEVNEWRHVNLTEGPESVMLKDSIKVPARSRTYRLDIEWLNCNRDAKISAGESMPGYNNFYNETCPEGAHEVRTFADVLYKNIYRNIDLRYYDFEGTLKYDFIVMPYANYHEISLQVNGARTIKLNEDGSIVLETPLGEIQEGAPIVYQNNKRLNATWVINGNNLTIEISAFDPAYELIIDPLVRVWGTYYGGNGDDEAYSCSTDFAGNVYMGGLTSTINSTLIATSGAYQTMHAGGTGSLLPMWPGYVWDGFLVKFNPAGVRLWGTYYGSNGDDRIRGCSADPSGNVFVVGFTEVTSSSTVLATPGAHQVNPTTGFGGNIFIAKFSAGGARLWGSFYGDGLGWSCASDAQGNLFITGSTGNPTSTLFATSSAHQSTIAGATDCILAKFNGSGVRLWGTYYGGSNYDHGINCAVDPSGNVILCGHSSSTVGAGISTSGAHQTSHGGGFGGPQPQDAILAKFNTSGVLLWGTYYGGTSNEMAYGCTTDLFGNIYMTGITTGSTNPGSMSTLGAHQPSISSQAGGIYDGFAVKFNASGIRQWGTYYGGSGNDHLFTCFADAFGNSYFAGESTSNGSVMTTPGAYQTSVSANSPVLVQFSPSGTRLMGTFYCRGTVFGSAVSSTGEFFLCGHADDNNTGCFASPGAHQLNNNQGGIPNTGKDDAFLVKFNNCPSFGLSASAISSVCSGGSVALSSTVTSTVTLNYLWLGPNSYSAAAQNTTITNVPYSGNGIYTLVVSDGTTCANSAIANVTILPPPAIVVSNGTICSGQSFTINPNGVASYTIGGGVNVVSPSVTTTYSVSGTSTAGCPSFSPALVTVSVFPLPTITVNSGSVCSGSAFTISALGAINYSITGGSAIVNPSVSTSYSVTGISSEGCVSATGAVSNVTVFPSPLITANSGSICSGGSFTINPAGAITYTYSGGSNVVIPNSSINYSVAGTNYAGCVSLQPAIASVTVHVTPTVVVNSSSICQGQSFAIIPSGANSYTISGGSFNVSPLITTSYSVTGASTAGCISASAAISNVTVHPIPIITVNSGTVCSGQSITINPAGANTYTISGGNFIVSPANNTNYSVTGTSTDGCTSTLPAVSSVTVFQLPVVTAVSDPSIICMGEIALVKATGAASYSWNNGAQTFSFMVAPTVNTTFTVTGTDLNGCQDTAIVMLSLTECIGLSKPEGNQSLVQIFPNPNTGQFVIELSKNSEVVIYNSLGQIIYSEILKAGRNNLDLAEAADGIYLIQVDGVYLKMIKE